MSTSAIDKQPTAEQRSAERPAGRQPTAEQTSARQPSAEQPSACHQAERSMLVYLAAATFCIVFDEIYALFGHGVRSAAMSLMFLYPLLGGTVPFAGRWLQLRQRPDHGATAEPFGRLAFNSYNSGIATLTVGSMLTGVFDIAGTTNPYLVYFRLIGAAMVAASLLRQFLYPGVA